MGTPERKQPEMNNENLLPKALNAVRNSTALKLIIIGAIIAVLQIPTLMI